MFTKSNEQLWYAGWDVIRPAKVLATRQSKYDPSTLEHRVCLGTCAKTLIELIHEIQEKPGSYSLPGFLSSVPEDDGSVWIHESRLFPEFDQAKAA